MKFCYKWEESIENKVYQVGYVLGRDKYFAQALVEFSNYHVHKLALAYPFIGQEKIPAKKLHTFLRQFSTLYGAGMPMLELLSVLKNSYLKQPMLFTFILYLELTIKHGQPLSSVFIRFEHIFPKYLTGMMTLAESAGRLDEVLKQMAVYSLAEHQLQQKIKAALFYPLLLVLLVGAMLIAMMMFIVPEFAMLYSETQVQLPKLTSFIFWCSEQFNQHLLAIGWSFIVIMIFFYFLLKHMQYKKMIMSFLSTLPVFRKLYSYVQCIVFARFLKISHQSGIPWNQTVELADGVFEDRKWQEAISKTSINIQQGHPFSVSLQTANIFPDSFTEMIAIGEKVGKLEDALQLLESNYQDKLEWILKRYMTWIEPMAIIIVGAIIGALVISMYLPIFSIGQLIL